MAGGTHVFDMITRLKENEKLRRKKYFKKTKDAYKRISSAINIDFNTATKAEREEIRNKILAERYWEIKKALMILMLSVLVTATIIFLFLKYLG